MRRFLGIDSLALTRRGRRRLRRCLREEVGSRPSRAVAVAPSLGLSATRRSATAPPVRTGSAPAQYAASQCKSISAVAASIDSWSKPISPRSQRPPRSPISPPMPALSRMPADTESSRSPSIFICNAMSATTPSTAIKGRPAVPGPPFTNVSPSPAHATMSPTSAHSSTSPAGIFLQRERRALSRIKERVLIHGRFPAQRQVPARRIGDGHASTPDRHPRGKEQQEHDEKERATAETRDLNRMPRPPSPTATLPHAPALARTPTPSPGSRSPPPLPSPTPAPSTPPATPPPPGTPHPPPKTERPCQQ